MSTNEAATYTLHVRNDTNWNVSIRQYSNQVKTRQWEIKPKNEIVPERIKPKSKVKPKSKTAPGHVEPKSESVPKCEVVPDSTIKPEPTTNLDSPVGDQDSSIVPTAHVIDVEIRAGDRVDIIVRERKFLKTR
jgi:hypothetical protein